MRYIGDWPAHLQPGIVCFKMPYRTGIHEHIRNALWHANLAAEFDEHSEEQERYRIQQIEGWHKIKDIPFGPCSSMPF